MNYPPTISIIIPVFNGEEYITDCLHALMEQTHPPLEIIVVDDGSTDRTPTSSPLQKSSIPMGEQVRAARSWCQTCHR